MTRLWISLDARLRAVLVMLAIALLPVAWYLGSPLFIDNTVNESFPGAALPAENQPAAMAHDTGAATAMPAGNAIENQAAGTMPAATAASAPGTAMEQMSATAAPAAGPAMQKKDTAAMTDQPIALSGGEFGKIDTIHKGQGQATLYKLPDGKRVLRFEDFKVTNGPDLYVYLSGHPMPRNGEQVHQDGFEVARLKGNIGSQNYELPDDLDLSKINSVVIYCRRFSVVFSTAELMPQADAMH